MSDSDIVILKADDVLSLLAGREREVIESVRLAYEAHAGGDSALPHSSFLRFPSDERNRIIALPAYLGEEFAVAGIKWISSFPGNLEMGLDRASAVVILNSSRTGRPEAVIEGSIISAKRTAASAALAAERLHRGRPSRNAAFLGCGLINFEIARFLLAALPDLRRFTVCDLDAGRAAQFAARCRAEFGVEAEVAPDVRALLRSAPLVSFATTAARPHVDDLNDCQPGTTLLHISLRDLAPELILASDNVVDDVDHVCRAQTSVHLAEQLSGARDFIRCTLADVLRGAAPARRDEQDVTIFSPFGLGVLDVALGKYVLRRALELERGSLIKSFLPGSWAGADATRAGAQQPNANSQSDE
jgi:2,3-diaminopropionate biosynthesis protein SbnB